MNQQKINEIIDKFFKDEDFVLDKVTDKIAHLMISRNIDFANERQELEKVRQDFKAKALSHPDILWKKDVEKVIDEWIKKHKASTLSKYNCDELKQKIGGGE